MPVPRPTRLPVAVATAAVLLVLTGLAGLTAAFWTIAGLAAVVTAVAALAPRDGRRPEPVAAPSATPTPAEVPADDADLVTLLTL